MKKNYIQQLAAVLFLFLTSNAAIAQCFSQIGANHYGTFGIKSDGTLWVWGAGAHTFTDHTSADSNAPIQVGTDSNWSTITSGYFHTLLQKTDGTLWGLGQNSSGELGNDSLYFQDTALQIGTDATWTQISAGKDSHTLAVKSDGSLWSWGNNQHAQLGDGTTTNRPVPTRIGTDNNWAQVSAGGYHSIAVKTDGTLWTWGENSSAQLGDGTTNDKMAPTQVGTLTTWAKVAAGENYSLAIKTDGTLWSWGLNTFGQLGDGTFASKAAPVQITTFNDWSKITANHSHCLAIRANQTLWAWGRGNYGQLGQGNNYYSSLPLQIGTETTWNQIAEGYDHSVGLQNDGSFWAWGSDYFGQVGDGVNIDNWEPTQVTCPNLATSTFENTANQVTAYPNPASNVLNIDSESQLETIELYDIQGRLILTEKATANHHLLSLSSLEKASYIVKVTTENGIQYLKIIKN